MATRVSGFRLAEPGIRVAPSLLAADFGRLAEQIRRLEEAGVEVFHLDIMDGHFVPNISFGTVVVESIRRRTDRVLDAHLMISEPEKYAADFVRAGCDHITFHVEVADRPAEIVEHIRSLGASAGVSLNPGTDPEALEPILSDVDMVLVMSVWPGFAGQRFIPEACRTCRRLGPRLRSDQRLEIDGGIGPDTVSSAVTAGADILVAGASIFAQPDPVEAYRDLTRRAGLRV